MHCRDLLKTPPAWIAAVASLATATPAIAQIVPDATLPNNSIVTPNGNRITIDGGTTAGSNLFHSFSEFSVPTGAEAFFKNGPAIDNIITRVTGSSISNIDGLIRANGTANLFLLNPNGIIFGPNAKLDIGGSFLGTTANSIQFSDGNQFSAGEPTAPPLLTINVPIGLQFGQNLGAIKVNGSGHDLEAIAFLGVSREKQTDRGFRVRPGNTLALVGNDLVLDNAVVTAESGRLELGSVKSGTVRLNQAAVGWKLGYDEVAEFSDIELRSRSLADASTIPVSSVDENGENRAVNLTDGGAIQVYGEAIAIRDGSVILIDNQGLQPPDNISIYASELLEITGSTTGSPLDRVIPSSIYYVTQGSISGGDIEVSTRKLVLGEGGTISSIASPFSSAIGEAKGSSIIINASEQIQIIGTSSLNPFLSSAISARTFGSVKTGEIFVSTEKLQILQGGTIGFGNSLNGTGNSGDITVNATDSIEIIGISPISSFRSSLVTNSVTSGNSGNLMLNTARLIVKNGGQINSSSFGRGTAGIVTINASESVEIANSDKVSLNRSSVGASVIVLDESLQELLGFPSFEVFRISGDININTPNLTIENSEVTVRNEATGPGGDLRIIAEDIFLDRNSSLSASTASGEGGNITLDVENSLQLGNGSQITAEAGGIGNGGNLAINTKTIIALENSDITANAQEGFGGRVSITAQGIFGTEFREIETSQSDIMATSDMGAEFSGVVDIRTPGIDTSSALIDLPENLADPTQQITPSCIADEGNSFTITGRGGLPPNPTDLLRGRALWLDQRVASTQNPRKQPLLIEATSWITHENGEIELVSQHQVKDNSRASTLNVEASKLLRRGKTRAALETWQKAAEAYRLAGDSIGVLGAIINQSQAWQRLGLYRRSQKILEQVNQLLETQPDTPIKATALQSLGVTLQAVGELERSTEILQQSLAISQRLGLDSVVSGTLLSLGNVASAKSDPETAINFYQQAADRATTSLEKTEALLNLLAVYVQEERGDDARGLLSEIEAEIVKIPVSSDGVYARVNLVDSLMKAGLAASGETDLKTDLVVGKVGNLWFDTAHHELKVAIVQSQELEDSRGEAIALHSLGSLYQEIGQLTTAQKFTEKSLLIAEGIQAEELVARSQSQLGKILKQQGKLEESIIAYSNAVKGFESLRKDLVAVSEDVQFDFRETVEPAYRDLVSLLLRETPSQEQLQQAVDLIEALQLAELDNFFQDACLEAKPQTIDEIDPTAAAIYPIILPESLEILLLQNNRPILHHQIKLSQTEVEKAILRMRNSLRITALTGERLSAADNLYNWLIEPFEEPLVSNQIKTLVFVLDGNLRNVPMAALYDKEKEEYLVEKYAIALTPGLQLLKSPSLEPEKVQAFTGGVSESVQGFAALPAVEWELKKISEIIPSRGLLNQEFTRENLAAKTENTPFPIIHLATHGQFSSNRDETFILAWNEKIKVTEFERLLRTREKVEATPIELLVLSACQTATGDERAALGLAGVAVRSGARSTLATLWSVQDGSTAELIVEFYRQLTNPNISKAEALRRAQVSMLKGKYKPPYFWAAFVLVGNWQ